MGTYVRLAAQIVIALGILEAYGLPSWFVTLIGSLKLSLAVLLIVGVWFTPVTKPAAVSMLILCLLVALLPG